MIEPGAVFEVAPRLAQPPQAVHRYDPAHRGSRWLLVVSPLAHCVDPQQLTVICVLLSAQPEYAADHDVLIYRGECVTRDSIAQCDLIFTLAKTDLEASRYRGTVQADTYLKVRAAVARYLEFA